MRNLKMLAFITLSALVVSACSSDKKNDVENASLLELNERAQYFLQDENYTEATRYLEAIEKRYAASTNSEQNQLNLIYVYYKRQDYSNVLSAADRFLHAHSTSQHLDYVLYMAGLTNQALGNNFIQSFFDIDRATRETTSLVNAYGNFETLVQHFPNSKYVLDASLRMNYIKNSLARHELDIAKFYAKRNASVAVANRCLIVSRNYPDTVASKEALILLKQSYERMGLTSLVDQTQKLIDQNRDKSYSDVEEPKDPDIFPPKLTA